jgi:hypothetical protein
MGSQRQVERPQDRKPPENSGPKIESDIDIGDTDDILRDLDVIEHPEKYDQEQRDCSCFRPSKRGGFR